jgi:hypothetical protein
MAIFRAITAEEEAAAGLMQCFKELGYARSKELNPHDHVHKHSIFPFMQILRLFFHETLGQHFPVFNLHIKEVEGETRLTLALSIKLLGEEKLVYPVPPLNFGVSAQGKSAQVDYSHQIDEFVKAHGITSVKQFLRKEANVRNTLLYAGPDGYPIVQDIDPTLLLERRRRVLAMLNLYLLIFPYKEHQPYVTQSLSVLVDLLQKMKKGAQKQVIESSTSPSQAPGKEVSSFGSLSVWSCIKSKMAEIQRGAEGFRKKIFRRW